MPAIKIDCCSNIKAILDLYNDLPSHNWLLSNVECYQSDMFDEDSYFLTDEELRAGISVNDPQFLWGCFSAVPAELSEEEVRSYDLPELENIYYLKDDLIPQHPEAFLEISVMDASYTLVIANDPELLTRLAALPYGMYDEEEDNRRCNAALRRIRTIINELYPDEREDVVNELQWSCWHALFRENGNIEDVTDKKIRRCLRMNFLTLDRSKPCYSEPWDPFEQK